MCLQIINAFVQKMQRSFGVIYSMLNSFEKCAMLCENSSNIFVIITDVRFIIPDLNSKFIVFLTSNTRIFFVFVLD